MIIGLFESHFCVSLYFLWHKESHKEKILDMNIGFATLEIYVFDEITERLCNILHFLLMVLGFSWLGLQLHCWKQNRENEIGEVEVGIRRRFCSRIEDCSICGLFYYVFIGCDLWVWFFCMMDGWDCVFGLKTIWPLRNSKCWKEMGLLSLLWARARERVL